MSKVWLVGITESKVPGVPSINDLLAHIARVSNPGNQMNTATASKLLKYLVKHKHWSPFEMAHRVLIPLVTLPVRCCVIAASLFRSSVNDMQMLANWDLKPGKLVCRTLKIGKPA